MSSFQRPTWKRIKNTPSLGHTTHVRLGYDPAANWSSNDNRQPAWLLGDWNQLYMASTYTTSLLLPLHGSHPPSSTERREETKKTPEATLPVVLEGGGVGRWGIFRIEKRKKRGRKKKYKITFRAGAHTFTHSQHSPGGCVCTLFRIPVPRGFFSWDSTGTTRWIWERDRKMGVPWNGRDESRWKEEYKEKRRMCGGGGGGSYYLWRLSRVSEVPFFFSFLSFFLFFFSILFCCIFARLPLSLTRISQFNSDGVSSFNISSFLFHHQLILLMTFTSSLLYTPIRFSQRWERPLSFPAHFNGGFLDCSDALYRI